MPLLVIDCKMCYSFSLELCCSTWVNVCEVTLTCSLFCCMFAKSNFSAASFSLFLFLSHRWFYRILPAVKHKPFYKLNDTVSLDGDDGNQDLHEAIKSISVSGDSEKGHIIKRKQIESNPNQIRWKPFPLPSSSSVDFVEGLKRLAGAGDAKTRHGVVIYIYTASCNMTNKCMFNSDGDFLIVPQEGKLFVTTEFGRMTLDPAQSEICVIQQGMKFKVDVEKPSRGYILEVFDNHFQLPSLGPIGANGLANPRDFLTPTAWLDKEGTSTKYTIACKFHESIWEAEQPHSPFDVVAWHGNYVPYKYSWVIVKVLTEILSTSVQKNLVIISSNPLWISHHLNNRLNNFMAINSVSFDHCVSCPS